MTIRRGLGSGRVHKCMYSFVSQWQYSPFLTWKCMDNSGGDDM
jgi:hypothetical protein